MASGMCTYLKNKLLGHLHGGASWSAPTTVYVGLATSVAADGTITGEPSGNGYSRIAVSNNGTTVWGVATNGSVKNATAAISFGTCTTTSWGTMSKLFVSDASSGNTNTLWWADLSANYTVAVGDAPTFSVNALVLTIG